MSDMCVSNDMAQDVTLGQIMVPEPVCVTRETSLAEAIEIIDDKGFDQLPVVTDLESKQLVGALTSRQIAAGWVRGWAAVPSVSVSEAMEIPWDGLDRNPEDEMSNDLLDYFSTYDFVVIVDDKKRVVGIVQLWDVAQELWNGSREPPFARTRVDQGGTRDSDGPSDQKDP